MYLRCGCDQTVSFAAASVGFTLTSRSVKVSSQLVEVCVASQGYGFTANISCNSSDFIGKLCSKVAVSLLTRHCLNPCSTRKDHFVYSLQYFIFNLL